MLIRKLAVICFCCYDDDDESMMMMIDENDDDDDDDGSLSYQHHLSAFSVPSQPQHLSTSTPSQHHRCPHSVTERSQIARLRNSLILCCVDFEMGNQ